ncbi:MAG: hypothetical protein BAJALOKI1v1_2310001 [Promethearchaeota archaeon]|nr:MAG: hypothetical protein BAJALOKI1v1_2310001 [Candidatus Lokiarchaeota archaeon]
MRNDKLTNKVLKIMNEEDQKGTKVVFSTGALCICPKCGKKNSEITHTYAL